jgi:hypothetical protein
VFAMFARGMISSDADANRMLVCVRDGPTTACREFSSGDVAQELGLPFWGDIQPGLQHRKITYTGLPRECHLSVPSNQVRVELSPMSSSLVLELTTNIPVVAEHKHDTPSSDGPTTGASASPPESQQTLRNRTVSLHCDTTQPTWPLRAHANLALVKRVWDGMKLLGDVAETGDEASRCLIVTLDGNTLFARGEQVAVGEGLGALRAYGFVDPVVRVPCRCWLMVGGDAPPVASVIPAVVLEIDLMETLARSSTSTGTCADALLVETMNVCRAAWELQGMEVVQAAVGSRELWRYVAPVDDDARQATDLLKVVFHPESHVLHVLLQPSTE